MTRALDADPRPGEVAACFLPPGARVTVRGRDVPCPDLESARYAVLGWHEVSGGALVAVSYGWRSIRNGKRKEERGVWEEAAAHLRGAELEGRPDAVYVVLEERSPYGRSYWVATGLRRHP